MFACTSPAEPEPPPSATLLVTNATCDPGPCSSFQVLGFPSIQFYGPGGYWSLDLGTVSTGSACLTLPSADSFQVGSPTEMTTYNWTSRDSLALGTMEPGSLATHATPSTAEFVPANSAGWSITLPGGTAVTPADVCG